MPTTFLNDTFTDADTTLLSAHTGETGATWTKHGSAVANAQIDTNRVRSSSTTNQQAFYYASGSPATAEYDVAFTLFVTTTPLFDSGGGPMARVATGANTFYFMMYNGNPGRFELYKRVAGVDTQLGTFSDSITGGTTRSCVLQIRDGAKKLFVTGTERISTADNAITAAGKAGVWWFGDATTPSKVHVDTLSGTDAQITIAAVAATATADGIAPNPSVAPDGVVGTATADGLSPVPVVSPDAVVGLATADGLAPTVSTGGNATVAAVAAVATADFPAPSITTTSTPVARTGGLAGSPREYRVETFLPVKPPPAVAVASMPAPAIEIVDGPVRQDSPTPLKPVVRRAVRPPPAPVSAQTFASPARAVASFPAPTVDAESFERALERVAAERIRAAEEEAMVLSMFG